jgi:hypothetical protein
MQCARCLDTLAASIHDLTGYFLFTMGPWLEARLADGKRAKNQMIQANLRLVVSIAKRYANKAMSFQAGALTLIRFSAHFEQFLTRNPHQQSIPPRTTPELPWTTHSCTPYPTKSTFNNSYHPQTPPKPP